MSHNLVAATPELSEKDSDEEIRSLYLYAVNNPISAYDYLGLKIKMAIKTEECLNVLVDNVRKKVESQLTSNSKVSAWFNAILAVKGMTVANIVTGNLDIEVGIYSRSGGAFASQGQTKWVGVFTGGWPNQPDKTTAVGASKFNAGLLT